MSVYTSSLPLSSEIPPMSLSASPMSLSASPAAVQSQPHRRLSARRGSSTALDPFGVHSELNHHPNRSSSSTLTIVRVVSPPPATPPTLNEPPSSFSSRRSLHHGRRMGPAQTSPPAPAAPDATPSNRLSFAFSSFSSSGPAQGGPAGTSSSSRSDRVPSPSSSPRLRPASPRLSASFSSKPRLTPEKLVELARQSTHPNTLAQIQNQPHSNPSSPAPASHSPVRSQSPLLSSHASSNVQPATFTPLPDDIFLPFIDRPAEVAHLIFNPPDVKLFSLLAQTFSSRGDSKEQVVDSDLLHDPATWSYSELIHHLTHIDRDIAPDFIWAVAARKCILCHSELIWERVKGALGIPPELDIDYDFTEAEFHSDSSVHTSDISDDEGRGAKGHWSDWDVTMDSPIIAKNPRRLSTESPSASIYFGKSRVVAESPNDEAQFKAHVDDRLQNLQDGLAPSSASKPLDIPSTGENTISPTPAGIHSPTEQDHIVIGSFSPSGMNPSPDETFLSIEPLIAPGSSLGSINPPPLSLPASLGAGAEVLGDIAEGAEEEEEEAAANDAGSTTITTASPNPTLPPDDGTYISPSQIQGLRISTSSRPTTAFSPPMLSPVSPVLANPLNAHPSSASNPSPAHSRASSFSSYVGPFQRSESSGNLASMRAALLAHERELQAQGGSGYASSDAGDLSDTPYDPVGDRAPGNPLFPSNFARLAVGPTLRANNPSLRSPSNPPASRYGQYRSSISVPGNPHFTRDKTRAYSHGAAGVSGGPPPNAAEGSGESSVNLGASGGIGRMNRWNRRSWGALGTGGEEFALSMASGSSVGTGAGSEKGNNEAR